MAFMKPTADYFKAYHVEDEQGCITIVPADVLTAGELESLRSGNVKALQPYVEGKLDHHSTATPAEGWYGRLSADGYLDCTDWEGPFASEEEAIEAIKDGYDVDDNGDPLGT